MKRAKEYEPQKEKKKHLAMLGILLLVFIWSAFIPYRCISWVLMALPTVLYVAALIFLYKKIKFTTFTYFIVLIQVIIMFIGAKYTYEFNPLFAEFAEMFNLNRNHFDRVAHFAQGFAPFFLIKEYLLRNNYMKKSKLFYLIVIGLVFALSAFYELLEFAAAIISKQPIISPQGDPWDTYWDMLMSLLGAISALLFLNKLHTKKMDKMK